MNSMLLVAAGGAIGSAARYLVGIWTLRQFGAGFPWGTITVNILGSLAIGLLVEVIGRRFDASPELRLFLVTGVLGGFTTFSAFSLDVVSLFERGTTTAAFLYIAASIVISLAAAFAGLALGRTMF